MKKRTTEEFIELAKQIHGNKYDYSKTVYVNKRTKVIITCPIHGDFEQTSHDHLCGHGCKLCGKTNSSYSRTMTTKDFIKKSNEIHHDKYDYSKTVYTKANNKVIITCPTHGDFEQKASHHLDGRGCPHCGIDTRSEKRKIKKNELLNRFNNIHNNKYRYVNISFQNTSSKIDIICPEHGIFKQIIGDHLRGCGCPKCSNQKSQCEDEIFNMLSDLRPIQHERSILDGREIDIYLPSHKLGIEYHGLRWHTDFFGGKGRKYHISKLNDCLDKGINLIQIFEDEYINHKEIVLNKITHIIGLDNTKPKIFARKCVVCEVTKDEAKEFLNKNHIQGFAGASLYLGLKYENKLIAVMSFLEESIGYWNLNRFATDITYNCIGAGGKLFKHFIRNYKFNEIKSFADRRWTINYNNNLYTKLGFENVGFTPAEYTYFNQKVDKYKRFHKFRFRKQTLHKKYGLPLTMTETEMIKELGYDRIWDCGLIKYVYKKGGTYN